MIDISAGSISPSGYLVLQADTSYNLFGNLVLDGTSFKGISGGNEGTSINGQGYTLTISDSSYNESTSFPTPIAVSKLTLINPTSEESWGLAIPDATCYAFTGPLAGPTTVGMVDISSDFYIHLSAGNQYTLSGDLAVDGSFRGFKVEGTGNVMIDCSGHTVTMTSEGGLMSNDNQGASLLVKHLTVHATGVALANGKGWIFGTGFTNMIAMNCHVTCGDLGGNSGGIFGGGNTGFVCATGCSVVCGNSMNNGVGGGGGMCGGVNGENGTVTISITNCSVMITGSVTNDFVVGGFGSQGGGGGGMCGGYNNANITITDCSATITGYVENDSDGGGGGMCGGYNGIGGSATITITDCSVTIEEDVTNDNDGGGGGMCGGYNGDEYGSATITITGCSVTIEGDVTNYDRGGGGGMCGGYNGDDYGTATITITDCSAIIGEDVTNDGDGGGGGMCGGYNGDNDGSATITITGCSVTIGEDVMNDWDGGGGGMCGGYNGGYDGSADITITNCYASIEGSVTNYEYGGGGGGMCGGYNGDDDGSVDISITNCYAEISEVIKFGSILGADMVNILLIPYSPYDLSLNGFTLEWVGGDDVNYNIYVGGVLRDLSDITERSADIASQLPYGIRFNVKSIYSERLSAASQPIFYLPPPAPTDLSLNGTILSWTGIPDVSYSVNYETTAGYTTITTQSDFSYNIQNYTGLNLTYFVQAIYGSSTSANSSTVSDTSEFSGSAVDPTTYIQAALDASSDITTLKDTLINHPSSFTPLIANLSNIDMTKFVTTSTTAVSSVNVTFLLPTADISSSLLPPSGTYLYLLGDVNSTVIYTVDGSAQTVFFGASSITVNGTTIPLGGNFLFYTRIYTFVGVGSGLIIPYSRPPPANPSRKSKPLSNKALRAANAFPSAAMRTRVVAGREIIRTLQSSLKPSFQSSDAQTQIESARAYIRGKAGTT